MNIPVIYEDKDLIVIDKPAGVTVNKSGTTIHEETIQDWAEEYVKETKGTKGESAFGSSGSFDPFQTFYQRGGVVHRLDKETSGILLLAKTPEAFVDLQRQFKERLVKKTYIALAHGNVEPSFGDIKVPVGRLPWNRKQFGIVPGGRESVTKYEVQKVYRSKADKHEYVSLVTLYPETGRTHQIRVHMKYIGFPLFADFLYSGRKTSRKDRKLLGRVFLHAAAITFLHPSTKEVVSYRSPLPSELQALIDDNYVELSREIG